MCTYPLGTGLLLVLVVHCLVPVRVGREDGQAVLHQHVSNVHVLAGGGVTQTHRHDASLDCVCVCVWGGGKGGREKFTVRLALIVKFVNCKKITIKKLDGRSLLRWASIRKHSNKIV